jgi:hypothetical protein
VTSFFLVGIAQSALWAFKFIGVNQAIMISMKTMTKVNNHPTKVNNHPIGEKSPNPVALTEARDFFERNL